AAPPTVDMSVVAMSLSAAAGVSGVASASLAVTAVKPRSRLSPWSPSPIARSSSMSAIRFSETTRCASSAQRSTQAVSSDSSMYPSHSLTQCHRMGRSVPQRGELVVERHDADARPGHVQGGDVAADERARDPRPALLQAAPRRAVEDVELERGRGPQAVDEEEHVLAGHVTEVAEHGLEEEVGGLVGGGGLDAAPAGLAVDPDADLDLVVLEVEGGPPGRGHRRRGEGDAHGADGARGALGDRDDGVEVVPALGGGTGDLLDDERAADAAPAGRPGRVLDGDVVGDEHAADGEALGLPELGGDLEVEHVAGVVLDDLDDPGAAVGRLHGGEDRLGAGRGEHG